MDIDHTTHPPSRPYGFPVPYRKYFSKFEEIVFSHGGKPHWAKMHKLKPEDLRRLYPGFDDYRRVLERVDPKGLFRSEYVMRHVFGVDVDSRIFKLRK
jgi:L-gulonolactone oxidase